MAKDSGSILRGGPRDRRCYRTSELEFEQNNGRVPFRYARTGTFTTRRKVFAFLSSDTKRAHAEDRPLEIWDYTGKDERTHRP